MTRADGLAKSVLQFSGKGEEEDTKSSRQTISTSGQGRARFGPSSVPRPPEMESVGATVSCTAPPRPDLVTGPVRVSE